jgi:integrase/recombinase XerD
MSLGKQAKILSQVQIESVLRYLSTTRYAERDRVILLLSVKAGLRAKEIASLKWSMITDAEGVLSDMICLTNTASKGRSGRIIPLNKDLHAALAIWRDTQKKLHFHGDFVVSTERGPKTSPTVIVNKFAQWYHALGFQGASSHSGRRTFITNAARQVYSVGGSLRDVQILAGHSALGTTQRYIEANAEAQRRLLDLI